MTTDQDARAVLQHVKISMIDPNPYRDPSLPWEEQKIEALITSIERHGLLTNVLARSTDSGRYEIAFGHHRIEAARRVLGAAAEVDLLVADLSEEDMVLLRVEENREEWTSSARVLVDGIRSIVVAFGTGTIALPSVPKKARRGVRVAPSFRAGPRPVGDHDPKAYTASTVAAYLGRVKGRGDAPDSIVEALAFLEGVEEGRLSFEQLDGLDGKGIAALVKKTSRIGDRSSAASSESPPPTVVVEFMQDMRTLSMKPLAEIEASLAKLGGGSTRRGKRSLQAKLIALLDRVAESLAGMSARLKAGATGMQPTEGTHDAA